MSDQSKDYNPFEEFRSLPKEQQEALTDMGLMMPEFARNGLLAEILEYGKKLLEQRRAEDNHIPLHLDDGTYAGTIVLDTEHRDEGEK